MKYKNIGGDLRFRAAASADKPHVKKVYEVAAGKTIELPVKASLGQLEPIKEK